MPSIARIIVDIALDREFDYLIPRDLQDSLDLGSRVAVPFGRRRATGYVIGLADHSERGNLKTVASVLGEEPVFDNRMLSLARWIGEYYCAPLEQVIRTILPGAVRHEKAAFKSRMRVTLRDESRKEDGRTSSPKQRAVIELVRARGGMFLHELTRELGLTAAPVRALERKGVLVVESAVEQRNPLAERHVLPTGPLPLMPEQAAALAQIKECLDRLWTRPERQKPAGPAVENGAEAGHIGGRKPSSDGIGTILLYGVTGSGKTEVYLQAIDYVVRQGKGAIVLVPEISLTPQTVERFQSRFGSRIAVLHSHLSQGARHDEWHRVREGKADIVIGARSAVFAPVKNLGIIVVDEEHEPSYKQEETPRYHARDVAVMRGHLDGCAVVLGSATPSLESWRNAKSGKYGLATLPRRADNRRMPVVRIVDMRMESEREGHHSAISAVLVEAIRRRLERKEQVILFLNRRGYATSLVCPKCGFVAKCDQCSVSCTYHRSEEKLRCHICGQSRRVPERCPGCQDPAFKFTGIGTQRVENIMKKLFPHAQVQRMDADVTTRKDSHDRILGDFRVGKTDILVGTQMIAKGLHFPNVTLVGVIYADLSLHIADFRAGERTFQLLAQVAGRAGRGDVPGEVVVQTYTPFNPAVQAARRLDYESFCDQELEFRRELHYPPFTHLLCITLHGRSNERVSYCAAALARRLRQKLPDKVMVSDAGPAPLAKAKGRHRYQIMARCRSTLSMIGPVRDVVGGFDLPRDISCSTDVDAISLL